MFTGICIMAFSAMLGMGCALLPVVEGVETAYKITEDVENLSRDIHYLFKGHFPENADTTVNKQQVAKHFNVVKYLANRAETYDMEAKDALLALCHLKIFTAETCSGKEV